MKGVILMPHFNEKQFEAEQDLRALREAEDVRSSPSRMKAAKRIASKEMNVLQKLTQKKRKP